MRLIKPSVKIIKTPKESDLVVRALKQIELAGRNCYKSEHLITEDSYLKFIEMLKSRHHYSPMEHGTIYLTVKAEDTLNCNLVFFYMENPYSKVIQIDKVSYITTNYRVLVENDRLDDLKFITEPTEHHEKRTMVRFICDRGIMAEFTRHRVFSFCIESTRYCNYSKDKYNNELAFIRPCWFDDENMPKFTITGNDECGNYISEYYLNAKGKGIYIARNPEELFIHSLEIAEAMYLELLNRGWKPQQARNILPNALKADMIMTGFNSDWKHFCELRCNQAAHPQARELAEIVKNLIFN